MEASNKEQEKVHGSLYKEPDCREFGIVLITVFGAILTDRHTKRSEITVFVWESDGKQLFPKLNFTQFMNRNVQILSRRLYSPSFRDVA